MTLAGHQRSDIFKEGFLEVEGFRIRYEEAGQGNQVVLLEGESWGLSKVRDALSEKYRVLAIELPGFGKSGINTESQSVPELAITASRVVERTVSGKFTLMGTSFAANVALWQTLQSPEIVEALILISPTVILPTEILPKEFAHTDTQEERLRLLLAHPDNLTSVITLNSELWAREQELVLRLKGQTHDAAAAAKLSEIRCPTLIVFGVNDRMVAPEAARVYAENIPNSNISLVYDTGHLIEAERPEALMDAVSSYVEHRETFIVGRGSNLINP